MERSLELNAKKLEAVLEACFFASFEREEGRTYDFRVAIAPPKRAMSASVVERLSPDIFAHAYVFNNSLDIDKLAKISPALATTHQRIGVWLEESQAKIWGFSGMVTRMTAAIQIRPFHQDSWEFTFRFALIKGYFCSARRGQRQLWELSQ